MPKIIKDIENKILITAIQLFKKHGYNHVDMRMIAKENGIAVGTLYNYYPNKTQLYLKAFESSWKDTFHLLDQVTQSDHSANQKIDLYIETLYDSMNNRQGLGRELIVDEFFKSKNKSNNLTLHKLKEIMNTLSKELESLLLQAQKKDPSPMQSEMEERLAVSIVTLICKIILHYPDEREKNIDFLKTLITQGLGL